MPQEMKTKDQLIYAVYYEKYDGALSSQDVLSDVRKEYFTSKKRQKNKIVKETGGVSYRYSYVLESNQPFKWKKLEGFRQVEISEPTGDGGYRILTQDENKKLKKAAYYDRNHQWLKTDYYAEQLKQQPMEILQPGQAGTLLRFQLQSGRYEEAEILYLSPAAPSAEAEQYLSGFVPAPQILIRTSQGDFYCCSQQEAQKREQLLKTYEQGGPNAPGSVFQASPETVSAGEDLPDREGGFVVAEQPETAEKDDNSYEWGVSDAEFDKYQEDAQEPSGVKYTEEYEYPYQTDIPQQTPVAETPSTTEEEPAYQYHRVEREEEPAAGISAQPEETESKPAVQAPFPRRYNVAVKPMSADTYTASDRIAPAAPKETAAAEDGAELVCEEKGQVKELCSGVMNGCPYVAMGKMSICVSPEECYYYYGEVRDGLREGRGRTAMMNGSTAFEGDYCRDQRDGFGVYYYKSGKLCYAGGWKENRRDGMGISLKAGDGSCYAGFWREDVPVGPGALLTPVQGLEYAGYFRDGRREGAGVAFQPENGTLFVGQWKNGVQGTRGTLISPEGALLYSGEIVSGKREGLGTEYDENGQVCYTGGWKNDAWDGQGVWYREDGHTIKGQFISGSVHGRAAEYNKNGVKIYEGGFENGVYHGEGCRYFPGGGRYEGSFLDGKPVGWLTGYDSEGNLVYEGHWENDEFQGEGRYFVKGEKVYEGGFVHNQFEGSGTEYADGLAVYRGGFSASSRQGLGVLFENGEPCCVGEFCENRLHGRANLIQNQRVAAEQVYQNGVLRYEKRYEYENGQPYLAFEGFIKNGKPGGMGCRYNAFGEKTEEGLYRDGVLIKSMQVSCKRMPKIPENPEDAVFEHYRQGPEYGVGVSVCGGQYTGLMKNGLPNGRGTMLRSDHRYTGEFLNGVAAGKGILYQNDGTILEGLFYFDRSGLAGLKHLTFENGVEYWLESI